MGRPVLLTLWLSISIGMAHAVDRIIVGDDRGPMQGPEHDLYRHILDSYKPDSRPVKNASDVVIVTFALSLNQLLDLDEKNQVLSTSIWIYEEWIDELLVWSAKDFHNQRHLMIPASSIWLPDIFIFNAAGDTTDGFIHVNGSKVAIMDTGKVAWMVPLMVNSACAVDVTYFPYDRQTCTIKFGSWIYDTFQLDIVLDASTPDLDHYVMNSEYDLENVSLTRGILDSSCCAGDGQHSMIELQLKLKRKSLFYDYIIIAPTIMLCVLTLASFLLPCDKGEKIAIGLTVFLTLYVLQLRIADNVPDTNSTPILGVFMLVVMTFNCVSLIMATIVMNIKKRGDVSQCPEVPPWLFSICDRGIGPIVCTLWKTAIPIPMSLLEEVVEHETAFDGPEILFSESDERTTRMSSSQYDGTSIPHMDKGINRECGCLKKECQDKGNNFKIHCPNFIEEKLVQLPDRTSSHNHQNNCILDGEPLHEERRSFTQLSFQKNFDGLRQRKLSDKEHIVTRDGGRMGNKKMILSLSSYDVITLKQARHINLRKRQWFYVAEVIDKFAFFVYLVLLTISIFTVLFLIPVSFRNIHM